MNTAPKILIIEKDESFRKLLHLELTYKGFVAEIAPNIPTEQMLQYIDQSSIEIILLGGEPPALQGITQRLRQNNQELWILAFLNHAPLVDKVALYEAGIDQHFDKPFPTDELLARLKSIIRRINSQSTDSVLEYSDLKMDLIQRMVWRSKQPVELRAKEFDLLKVFLQNPEEILNREFIFDHVWGSNFLGDSNVIEVYIRYLRDKLGKPGIIKTKRGQGYILISEDAQIRKNAINIELPPH